MPAANLHGVAVSPTNQLTPVVSIEEIDRAFGTPYGFQREMGFNVVYRFHNTTTTPGEIGSFGLTGYDFGKTPDVVSALGDRSAQIESSTDYYRLYPGDTYSPLIVVRSDETPEFRYNACVGVMYPVVEYDHIIQRRFRTGDGSAELRFRARNDNGIFDAAGWYKIPPGERRTYRLFFRINDRTDTNIGKAADAPQEWLWTLHGYQQYFRKIYGKPDYRRMGGWDGRPILTRNSSRNGTYNATTNSRTFSPDPLDNPSTNGAGGDPDGYYKFTKSALQGLPLNIKRVLIWALSGFDVRPRDDYDPRFATGVLTMGAVGDGVGPTTIRPAMRLLRERMQLGFYWGRATAVPNAAEIPPDDTWSDATRHNFDTANPADVARLRRETDLAIPLWGGQFIGLDAYALPYDSPRRGYTWLRDLQKRYPNVLFVTELDLPDFLHTRVPTYSIEFDADDPIITPFWIANYLNPGCEYLLQIDGIRAGTSQAERADEIASIGLTPVARWDLPLEPGTRAVSRWSDLGERPIPGFNRSMRGTTNVK